MLTRALPVCECHHAVLHRLTHLAEAYLMTLAQRFCALRLLTGHCFARLPSLSLCEKEVKNIFYFCAFLKNMIIRPATLNDIEPIMTLVAEVVPMMCASGNFQWDDTYPNAEVFTKDIELGQLWVAEVGEDIAGFAAITTDQDAEYANVGLDINEPAIVTHRLAVSINHRRQGVAEALLKQAEIVALKKNINILRVDTNSNNKATRILFPKLGYEFAGETGLYFRPNLRFYCYEKRLS